MSTQTQKDYAGDWAKAKSRDLVRDMIQRTLLKFRRPSQLRVLFFPGIDAAEVYQVYDTLGIPRENLVGVEREASVVRELERKNLGIQLVHRSLEDYVSEQDCFDFDVVSLDYTGPISHDQIISMKKILGDNIRNHVVLHSANLMKRDHKAENYYKLGYFCTHQFISEDIDEKKIVSNIADGERRIQEMDELLEIGKAIKSKSVAYSVLIKKILEFTDSNQTRLYDELLKFVSGKWYDKLIDLIENEMIRIHPSLSHIKRGFIDREKPTDSIVSSCGEFLRTEGLLNAIIYRSIKEKFIENGFLYSRNFYNEIISSLHLTIAEKKFYRARDFIVYSYISESGSPIIGDLLFISHSERLRNAAISLASRIGYPHRFDPSIDDFYFLQYFNNFVDEKNKCRYISPENYLTRIENRLFLGNSSKPVLTKQRAIEEFRNGASVEVVQEKYRGWLHKPLAQWKAHVTMGTYDKVPKSEDEIVEYEEDSGLEKITKEDAIDFLASGIPPQEIYEAYPTSFTQGQLRAFKAHITMGTYEQNNH